MKYSHDLDSHDEFLSLSQCRTVKITILGDEGVPIQVDGEAWIQPPGVIKIQHKNRAQMLTRDRVSVSVQVQTGHNPSAVLAVELSVLFFPYRHLRTR